MYNLDRLDVGGDVKRSGANTQADLYGERQALVPAP